MIGMRYGLHEWIHQPTATLQAPANPEALLEHYRTQLKLSAEQTKKLSAVLADYQRYYQAVQEQIDEARLRDQIEDLRSTGKSRILEILSPEQREQFEKMTKVDPALPSASE
jgi:Spy/CpxP family protein refolding chaperone